MGARFQDPSLGNSSPWIYVWNMWSFFACTGFAALRIWIRRDRFGLDDLLNAGAYVAAVTSCGLIFGALHEGLGAAPDDARRRVDCSAAAARVVASICMLLVTDGLSKASTLCLMRRILTSGASPDRRQRGAVDALLAATAAWIVLAVALNATDCSTACSDTCNPNDGRMIALITLSIVVELLIFTLALWIFGGLHMSVKLKLTTFALFAIRLPLAAVSVVFLCYYARYLRQVDHAASYLGPGIYWQCTLLAFTTIVPAFQALKSTMPKMATLGSRVDEQTVQKAKRTLRLRDLGSSLTSSSKRSQHERRDSRSFHPLRGDDVGHDVQVVANPEGSRSHDETFGSDLNIIRQETRWAVEIE